MYADGFNYERINEGLGISKQQIQDIQNAIIDKYGEGSVGEAGADGILGGETFSAIMRAISDAVPSDSSNTSDTFDYTLPINLTGSYTVGSRVPAKYDARHSFDRRKFDKFGGRMLMGWESSQMKSRWGDLVKLDQGKGINQVMYELISRGITPDVTNIKVEINGMSVRWSATIDSSRDGQRWVGVATRGSAGGGRANMLKQVEKMKKQNPNFRNWTVVLEIDNVQGISQQFLKYTL